MCGIFALINKKSRKFDRRAFITMGCDNDTRGGDACGVFIDGSIEYGTEGNDKFFQCWYPKSKLIFGRTQVKIAIGHCRKASVGGKDADKAQPVVIRNSDGDIEFCIVHNGTIYNYEELAKKYIPDVDITGMSDSQVMARIFYYKGYDVLTEYRGAAVFIITDYRINKTYVFKGESKATNYGNKIEEERPLFMAEYEDGVAFSSIYLSLRGLYFDRDVWIVPSNQLLEVVGNTVYVVKDYDRTNSFSCKGTSTQIVSVKKTEKEKEEDFDNSYYDGDHDYHKPDIMFRLKDFLFYTKENGKLVKVHGKQHISKYGYTYSYETTYSKTYYFWHGLLLCGKAAFDTINEYYLQAAITAEKAFDLAKCFSVLPFCIGNKLYFYGREGEELITNESFEIPFSKRLVQIGDDGTVCFITHLTISSDPEVPNFDSGYCKFIKKKYDDIQRNKTKVSRDNR